MLFLLPGQIKANPCHEVRKLHGFRTFCSALIGFQFLALDSHLSWAQSSSDASTTREREIEEVLVIGTNQSRYIIDTTDPNTGLDLDFLSNPRNISIIPEQLVLDRKITTLEEALRNVPGITAGDGFGGTNDDFFQRGFRRNALYRNGFRRATGFKTNLTNIEYTQVIRGPASIRYGRVEPGGVVDVVTKKPLEDARFSGELRYGSFDDGLVLIDLSQPINDKAAVRLVGSMQQADSFRDFTNINRDTIAISAHYDFAPSTRLLLSYEYRDESRPLDRGTIAVPTPDGLVLVNELLDIPFSRRFGDPFEEFDTDFNFFEAIVTHQFAGSWNAKLGIAIEDSVSNDLQSRPLLAFVADAESSFIDADGFLTGAPDFSGVFDDPTDRVFLAKRLDGSRGREHNADFANLLISGEVQTGPISHQISFGGDFRDSETIRRFTTGASTDGVNIPFFNIAAPVYNLPSDFSVDGLPRSGGDQQDTGVFINSYTELTERLGVLLGVRYSETESNVSFEGLGVLATDKSEGTTPQIGFSFAATDDISIYGSYSESFQPNGIFDNGERVVIIDPEEGEQLEFGVKGEFLEGRLRASFAVYDIQKTNVVIGEDELGVPILADGATSEGVEFSVTGQPIEGMNITASYAYIDAETSSGLRPSGVADNVANIYASYEWQSGALEGLGIGGGVFYEGDRFAGPSNVLELEDYVLVDASLWYTMRAPSMFGSDEGTLRFQLAVKNVFDEEYFNNGGVVLRIPLGVPRTVFGSVSFDY
ncbi:MAG: TonB-dependent siderophore receptor [Pseudomonadota bacterium]